MIGFKPVSVYEHELFYACVCRHCECDREYRKTGFNGCDIIPKTMIYDLGDPEYPSEWIYRNNMPVCTAFKDNVVLFSTLSGVKNL